MSQVFLEENKLKLSKFEKNCDFVLKSTVRKRAKNNGKVAKFYKIRNELNLFSPKQVNFGSTGGKASSGPYNTGWGSHQCYQRCTHLLKSSGK
jgi:hypothetical protein